MNNENNRAVKLNDSVMKIVHAVPIWGWTLILMVLCVFSRIFIVESVFNSFSDFITLNTGSFIAATVMFGIVFALVLRVFIRLVYAVASRIYFRSTSFVPDFNLRRLPVGYNDFCGFSLFLLCIINAFSALMNVLIYAVPVAVYFWYFVVNLAKLGVFVFGWFAIRSVAADWQCKSFFISLAIPAGILLGLTVFGGF